MRFEFRLLGIENPEPAGWYSTDINLTTPAILPGAPKSQKLNFKPSWIVRGTAVATKAPGSVDWSTIGP